MVRPMPENGGHFEVLLRQLHDSVGALSKDVRSLDQMLRGHNGEAGVLEQARDNRQRLDRIEAAIAKLENTLEVIRQPGMDIEVTKVRWHVVGSAIALAAGILSFAMQIYS